jgi:membrane protein Man1
MKKIHNDILTKCKAVLNSIVHIACDKKSREGCVYIKCSNNDAAGRIYITLNNTWYNGKSCTILTTGKLFFF